ncbi:alkaline phosphatase family protein [Kitasatospora sp. NPDC087271]|uniref:alkaline phosphatase family protein n=1 Tax=Kitasatospora sp. NPDC087271 TaxID=3364067 RepID=UPI0037F70781
MNTPHSPQSAPSLPDSLLKALKREPRPGGLKAIRHVVFLMQENRSFDHYFGSNFRGVRGYDDRNLVTFPGTGGRTVLDQPDPDHPSTPRRPYQLRPDQGTAEPAAHNWPTGHQAWNNGRYDQWIKAKGTVTMGYFDQPEVVGTYRALAERFTVCDAYHCSVMSETTSNRNYLFSGFGGWEPDGSRVTGSAAHDRENPDATYAGDRTPGYGWSSYPEILEVNNDPFGSDGISWRVYQGWDNYYDNNLEFHAEFKRIFQTVLKSAKLDYLSLYDFYKDPKRVRPEDVEALAKAVADLPPADRSLYDRGLFRCPPPPDSKQNPKNYRDFVHAFAQDVAAKRVPRVSYLVPSDADSEHPGDGGSAPMAGEEVVAQVLDVIASDEDMWDSTVLFISYDENDGFFDHVPPPVPPQGVDDEYVGKEPIGLGMRVPMIVVSPWTVGGYVNSQVFDHTSQVRFLEEWLGVRQPAISRWRRTVAGNLTSVFDFDRTGDPPPQPTDPTRRLARPLPYQPDAHGALDQKQGAFVLQPTNTGAASVHLTLYDNVGTSGAYHAPQHFDVLGTTTPATKVKVREGSYDFYLTGPNGFRREFAGKAAGAAAETSVATAIATAPKRVLTLTITSPSATPQTVTVAPRHYSTAKALTGTVVTGKPLVLVWDTDAADGWYDLDLAIAEDASFRRRLMGHVENGHPSISG